jgi:hypothetical protein
VTFIFANKTVFYSLTADATQQCSFAIVERSLLIASLLRNKYRLHVCVEATVINGINLLVDLSRT